ncbi:CYTOCHROME P450 FAMILY MEMBER [Salix viminalis]|uniref:CYTOCHROME P450 FAMILY MEMBER n=1 Tax=Salix viminalis TaxID=40686 RepID=A0A9Q0TBI1_SALVM|nr:CYTOCHROME P450 FAMILY MEMBER [Salix viminalis]
MEKQGVRGPKPRPLTGNILDVASFLSKSTSKDMDQITHDTVSRLLPHYVAWSKQYGKRFIFWNGVEPRLCISETEMIKELLTNDWSHQRHIAAPSFMGERLKSNAGLMVECTKNMLQSLRNAVESGLTEVEIGEYMSRVTADIISRTQFGSSYEKGKQIFHLLTELQSLCHQATRHLCLPGSRFFPSNYNRQIKSKKMEVDRLLLEIIQSRKDCVEIGRSSSYGDDLLGMLLNEMERKRSDGFNINLQLVMDECKTFFFAGHETTSLLLTWTVMLLASNPCWQDKVRAEVSEVCNGETPSIDHLPKFNLASYSMLHHFRERFSKLDCFKLNMVISESLRLYPSGTLLPRMAFEDIKLGDLEIPKGLQIWIPVLAIHHSEELWGKDANEFNPDRFASKSFAPGRHFIPFAAGPRNCIGQSFAMMEAKIILAMLISQFSFNISDSYRHAPVVVLTIKPKYGVQVYLKPLNS